MQVRYVAADGSFLVPEPGDASSVSGAARLLLGARVHVDPSVDAPAGWAHASTVPKASGQSLAGFIESSRLSDRQQLKVFYLDVGQGDSALIEAHGRLVLIDAGPNNGVLGELEDRRRALVRAEEAVGRQSPDRLTIDVVVISHFDSDHYFGLTSLMKSDKFSIGKVFHNGLPRYSNPDSKDLGLGTFGPLGQNELASISTDFDGIDSLKRLVDEGYFFTASGGNSHFRSFAEAALEAHEAGRLGSIERLVRRDPDPRSIELLSNTGPDLRFEVLGPVSTTSRGRVRLPSFSDPHGSGWTPSSSHTINGNSIVLRLQYGVHSFLFGGDLNAPAQDYLRGRYGGSLVHFAADVNKACHHGSSDFDVEYLSDVNPHATVFSSGDNGSHDHPLPDAMGAAAKASQGVFPLIFSTELARESNSTGVKLFGHINARSNGIDLVMAQKKEKPSLRKPWHAFTVPYDGPFH